jgi:hypothetical protein
MFGNVSPEGDSGLPQPREYLFFFKDSDKVIPAFGYPAFNGQIYAVLDSMDDPLTINFICSAADVLYVADSELADENS